MVSAGYMPVTQEAFDTYMPKESAALTEFKYIELYKGYEETQKDYTFFVAPLFENYQTIEEDFEDKVRLCLNEARSKYLAVAVAKPFLMNL